MTSRKRFELTMRHQQPDRVPLDLGSTSLTGIRPGIQKRLCKLLGFPEKPGMVKHVTDERILDWAGTDFRAVGGIVSLPGKLEKRISETTSIDCWGIRYEFVGGDNQISKNPLKDANLEDLKNFPWPEPRVDDKLLAKWEARAKELKKEGKHVIIAEHPVFGVLELGCWMCGYDTFLYKIAGEEDFTRAFFDKVLEIQLKVIEQYYSVLGPYIDLTISGDDFGMQTGPLMSPGMFNDMVAPYFTERIKRTKELGKCYYWHHSCGSIPMLIDSLIKCGVDILNPIQTSATGMDPESLKSRFGDRIVFWGALDVQQFLPNARPEEVGPEVRRLISILGKDGGYVMAAAHEIIDDIPPENIVAWVEALRK